MGFLKDLLSGGAGSLVSSVGNVLDNVTTTKEEKLQLELEQQKAEHQYQLDMAKLSKEERQMFLQDTQSARQMAMTVQTSKDAPWLARNISPIMAMGTTILTFFLFYIVLFRKDAIGQDSKDVILYILGVLSAIVTQIYSFYFGSSQGSSDKNKMLQDLNNKVFPPHTPQK